MDCRERGVALENGLDVREAMRAKDVRRPWRSAHPCRRSGGVYSRGRVLRCNLLPWGWYGEWEQDDDETTATLERWVMEVRSRRKWGAQGPRLTRRASLEWACRHLDPALGAGMTCVFDFGNVLVTGNMHDGGSGSGGHRGTMHDYVGWRTLQGRRASASAAPGLDGHEEASREEMEATLGVME